MSDYNPQVGDRVRRTYPDGTILEGVIAHAKDGWAGSQTGFTLYSNAFPEQTVLLERPFKLNTEPGTVYGHPVSPGLRVVMIDTDDGVLWLGNIGNTGHWHAHDDIGHLVRDCGWVEFDLDGSRKND